jgi:hypothetical protein
VRKGLFENLVKFSVLKGILGVCMKDIFNFPEEPVPICLG